MKKQITQSLFLIVVFVFLGIGKMYAQEQRYQLRNSDFETPFVPSPGSSSVGTEPQYWHSFGSVTGSLASTARNANHISQSTDTRNGIGYSARLSARNVILGIIANGNLTTGRVNAGNMTASNPANHNFTDPNDSNFNEPWTATPDSIRFWAKYTPNSATQWARMSAYIHDDYKFTDPLGGDPNSPNYIVSSAELEWQRGDQGWHQYIVPFDYASYTHLEKSPKYILITFTTNKTPGAGAASDALYIDDIEMIYSAWLNDLQINGQTIAGFEKGLLTYGGPRLTGTPGSYAFPYQPEEFTWTAESPNIRSVEVTNVPGPGGDADGGYTSILVTAEDGVTTKEYKIMYNSGLSDDNSLAFLSYTLNGVTGIPVPNFSPSVLNYDIFLTNPEETRIPQITSLSAILSDASAEITNITQPTSVNSTGSVTVRAENLSLKVYTLNFSKAVSTVSKLSWLQIGGEDVGFAPETLEYNYEIEACVGANNQFPTVTYEKASYWANVVYTAATLATPTATIEVTAEDGTKTTYTVNFMLKSDNTGLLGYRINTTNRNNTFNAGNEYTDTYAASLTAVPTLSLSTTAGQQVCGGSSVAFPETFVWYPDTNKIVVTAQNGIDTQEYGVVVKNTNPYLATGAGNGLKYTYNGVTYNNINITTTNNNNTNTVNINITLPAGPNEPAELFGANTVAPVVSDIIYTQPAARQGTGSVRIIANDGTTNKTYNINFTPTISNVATLSNITYNDGANQVIGFNPAQENYTMLITSNVTEVPQFTATPTFEWLPEGNIVYQQAQTFQDAATITVTAENGTTVKTYTINFEVIEPANDAYVLALKYDGIDVPNFNPAVFEYTVNIPYAAALPTLSATTTSPTATPFYIQPTENSLTGIALVYSENMTATKAYMVHFVRGLSPETAINLVKYEYNDQIYTYTVTGSETEITIALPAETEGEPAISEIVLLDNRSTYQIDEQPSESNNMTATVTVTAEDGTEETYSIAFVRTLSGSTLLTEIRYNGILLEDFDPNTLEYTVIYPRLPEVTVTPAWINTDVQIVWMLYDCVLGYHCPFGVANIIVTSENGENTVTYMVRFEPEYVKSDNANLAYISVDDDLIADFDVDVTEYSVVLPANYVGLPTVTAVAQHWYATVDIFTQDNKVFITVTAENEEVIKIYEVTFTYGTGVSETVADNFTFYPNPVRDVLNVETGVSKQVTLQIIDNSGRVVLMKTVTETAKIDVSRLPVGIYNISIDGVFGGRFVKQ